MRALKYGKEIFYEQSPRAVYERGQEEDEGYRGLLKTRMLVVKSFTS